MFSRATCVTGNSGARRRHALETLLCPHPGLLNTSGLCPKTLLVSARLGGGAATGHLVTHHQEDERERRSNQTRAAPGLASRCSRTVRAVYKEGASQQALPVVGQLDGRLRLSPQRLRGDKALEIKRLFPREHVIHGAAQLVREYGERFGFAVFVFQFRKILFARLILA